MDQSVFLQFLSLVPALHVAWLELWLQLADVVTTRMMNQRAIVGHVDLYKGTLDGILKVRT